MVRTAPPSPACTSTASVMRPDSVLIESRPAISLEASSPAPMKTADGSPRRRAIVSISRVVFRTVPSTWSTRTRTSAMRYSYFCSGDQPVRVINLVGSDELVGGQELCKLGATVTLIGDDLALRTWRTLGEGLDLGPGRAHAHRAGVEAQVGQRPRLDRLLLRGHDALEGRIARLVDLVGDRNQSRQRSRDRHGGRVTVATNGHG